MPALWRTCFFASILLMTLMTLWMVPLDCLLLTAEDRSGRQAFQ